MGTAQSEQFRYSFEGDLDGLQRQHKQIVGMFNKLVNDINQISKGLTIGGGNVDTSVQTSGAQNLINVLHNLETKKVDNHQKAAKETVDIDKETAKQQEKIAKDTAAKLSNYERQVLRDSVAAKRQIARAQASIESDISKAQIKTPTFDYGPQLRDATKQFNNLRGELRAAYKDIRDIGGPDQYKNIELIKRKVSDTVREIRSSLGGGISSQPVIEPDYALINKTRAKARELNKQANIADDRDNEVRNAKLVADIEKRARVAKQVNRQAQQENINAINEEQRQRDRINKSIQQSFKEQSTANRKLQNDNTSAFETQLRQRQAELRALKQSIKEQYAGYGAIERKVGSAQADIQSIFSRARERMPGGDWGRQEQIAMERLLALQNQLVQARAKYNALKSPENTRDLAATEKEISNLVSGTRRATNETLKATGAMGSAWGRLQSVLSRIAMWWGTAFALWKTGDLIRQVYNISGAFEYLVKELTAIGDEGEKAYRRLAMAGYDAAEQTGRRFEEAAVAMREFVRQGFSVADINDLVKTTLIGLNITEMGATQLIKSLTAEMRAFNIPARDSISIIDKLMGVSKEYAIDANELATGIRKFAGVSQQANLTLDQQMGIMTAVMERTKQAPEAIGTGWRTILTRLQRNAVDAVENIAKVQVYTDKSRQTYRSMWDILNDLAQAWPKMTAAAKEEVAFQAAGQRQIEFFIAAMEGWDTAIQATVQSMASAGMAYKTNAMLVDTLQKSVAALRIEWEKLLASQNGVSNYFKTLVDGIRSLLNISAQIPESVGAIAGAVAMLGGFGVAISGIGGGLGLMGGLAAGFAGLGATISYVMGKMDTTNIRKISERYKELIATQYQTRKATSDLAQEFVLLYKKSDETKNKQDNLKLIWTKLNELNPSLIQGARNLGDVYSILAGKVEELSKAEQEAFDKRQQMIKSEKEVELSGLMRDLSTQRKKMPIEFQSMSDEQLIAELPKAYTNLNDSIISINEKIREQARLQETINNLKGEGIAINQRDYDTLSKVRDALQENLKTAVDDNKVKRAAKALSLDRKDMFGLPTMTPYNAAQYGDVLYPARGLLALQTVENTMERIKNLKEGEVLTDRERSQLATSLVTAENVLYGIYAKSNGKLVANQEEQAKMFQDSFNTINAIKNTQEAIKDINGVGKIKGFGEEEAQDLGYVAEETNKWASKAEKLLTTLEQQAEILTRQEYILKGITISKENQGLFDKQIYDWVNKTLQDDKAIAKLEKDINVIKEARKQFEIGGEREMKSRISLLESMQEIQKNIDAEEKKNNDTLLKGLDKQVDAVDKLYQMQEEYNQAIKDRRINSQADQLKVEEKPVEAAGFLLDYYAERWREAEAKFKQTLGQNMTMDSEIAEKALKNITTFETLRSSIDKYNTTIEGIKKSGQSILTSPDMAPALEESEKAMNAWQELMKTDIKLATKEQIQSVMTMVAQSSAQLAAILNSNMGMFSEESQAVISKWKMQLDDAVSAMGGDPDNLKKINAEYQRASKAMQDWVSAEGNYNTELVKSIQKVEELQKAQSVIKREGAVETMRINRGETAALEYNIELMRKEKAVIDDLILSTRKQYALTEGMTHDEGERKIQDLQNKALEKENEIKKATIGLDNHRLSINKEIEKELVDIGFREKEQQIERNAIRNGEIRQLQDIVALRKEEMAYFEADLMRKYPVTGKAGGLAAIYEAYPEEKKKQLEYQGRTKDADNALEIANIHRTDNLMEARFNNRIDRKREENELQLVGMEYSIGEIGILEERLKQEQELAKIYEDQVVAADGLEKTYSAVVASEEQQKRVKEANLALTKAQASAEQELLNLVIQTSAAQIQSMISGDFSAGGLVQGLAPILISASGVATGGTSAMLMTAGAGILASLFDDMGKESDKNTEALKTNTYSLDRLNNTMDKIWSSNIGVSSSFILPPNIAMMGQLPYGGGGGVAPVTNVDNSTKTIVINAGSAPAKDVAMEVKNILDKDYDLQTQKGYVARKY